MKKQVKKNNAGKNERRFGVILTPFLKEPLEKKTEKPGAGGGHCLVHPYTVSTKFILVWNWNMPKKYQFCCRLQCCCRL